MARLEALIVAALGRSPYEDDIIPPSISSSESGVVQTGQQYDERGHPINPESRQQVRDHIRASNEVMQTVGIVEDTAAIRERDKAEEDIFTRETDIGLQRLETGKFLCVAGVWGVGGLRRRILLYQSYSGMFSSLLRREMRCSSVSHLMGAGFPALLMYQVVEWTRNIVQGALGEFYRDQNGRLKTQKPNKMSLLWVIDRIIAWTSLNYHFHAILQQLDVAPSTKLLPSFKSLIPFSSSSPLQLPPFSLLRNGLRNPFSWASALLWGFAPLASVLIYSAIDARVSRVLYHPVYRFLPGPLTNITKRHEQILTEISETLDRLQQNVEAMQAEGVDLNTDGRNESPEWDFASAATHTATLHALEGRAIDTTTTINHDQDHEVDSSDDDNDGHEMSQQTVITFDVEAEDISDPGASMGAWSAELRNTNESENELSKPPKYRITPLTMMPLLLAVDGLLAVLTHVVTLPFEAAMVRIIGHAYGANKDMLAIGFGVPWRSIANLLAVYSIELVVTGVIWTGFTLVSQVSSGKFRLWKENELD